MRIRPLSDTEQQRFLYSINYTGPEEELCRMELKYLLHGDVTGKCFFSDVKVDPSRSPFIRHRLSILHAAATLDELADRLRAEHRTDFAFMHFKFEGSELTYEEWRDRTAELVRAVNCAAVDGATVNAAAGDTSRTLVGLAKKSGVWYFGEYAQNDNRWKEHDRKPETNSHSLGLRTARALVNIAVPDAGACTLVDPCCGVGTVLIEALSMGVAAKGFEINWRVAESARINLDFFGFPDVVAPLDMHGITEHFDVSIVDIPYGLFTPVTPEEQVAIIRTARRISDRMVIITFEDMDESIRGAGFRIVDRCRVCKGRFVRYISLCE